MFPWESYSGACYLRLINEEHRMVALYGLGVWPTVGELLCLPARWFRLAEDVERLFVLGSTRSKSVHLEWDADVDVDSELPSAIEFFLACSWRSGYRFPKGSYGAKYANVPFDVASWRGYRGLDVRVGGLEPVLPVASMCTPGVYEAFNWAVAAYYGLRVPGEVVSGASGLPLISLVEKDCVKSTVCEKMDDVGRVSVGSPVGPVPPVGEQVVLEASVVEGSGRGPNYERNKANREAQKNRKKARKIAGCDWRRRESVADVPVWKQREGCSSSRVGTERRGFFFDCDDAVQKDLRETRARLLIAENRRRAAEEEAKLKRMTSPEAIVHEMVRVTAMANRLVKQTADAKIGGWAKTVAESLTKSVAESAPSSVPTLESVGYGKSALKSSSGDGDVGEKQLREVEFGLAMVALEKRFENVECYSDEEYEFAVREVKASFSDVAYTEKENMEFEIVERLVGAAAAKGLGYEKIQDILELAGLKCN